MQEPEHPPIHDDVQAYLKMGTELATSDRGELALKLIAQAAADRPHDPRLTAFGAMISSYQVHKFHHGMLRDTARNALYRKAIERLAPGKRVLDIGTGSGLLAMIAARAGAKSVVACEHNPMLAATAREIIEANGLTDKITVIGRNSAMLDRRGDLDGGVDLVISEIFSDNLLGENVLPALNHAREELCLPGAIFIPDSAEIRTALAISNAPCKALGEVEGLDLSLFNRHLEPYRTLRADSGEIELASDPETAFRFDFNTPAPLPLLEETTVALNRPSDGANGCAQWIRFTLAEGLIYENAPGADEAAHWPIRFTPWTLPDISGETSFPIGAWHDEDKLVIWPQYGVETV